LGPPRGAMHAGDETEGTVSALWRVLSLPWRRYQVRREMAALSRTAALRAIVEASRVERFSERLAADRQRRHS